MTRDDRVIYVYLNLIDKKSRNAIYRTIEDMGITSVSTAQRTVAKIDKWGKSEKELFLATFTPPETDLYQLKDILEEKENDSLAEIAAKNEELQKELHTSKKVIESLQNEVIEKSEEIRTLRLEHADTKTQESEVASEFREIIEEMIALYISKNKDYGNAFSQSYNEFGAVMAVIRINDKLNRFKTLIKQDSEVKTESLEDTLMDLANYAVMTIIEMKRRVLKLKTILSK